MNELQIFQNSEFGEVRTTVSNGKPMFCLADVCRVLEIANVTNVKNRLSEDGVHTMEVIDSLRRKQNATFISESNLYKTIFQSRKDSAEKFTEWVTSEVLPSIRKHGMYAKDELLDNPDLLISVAQELKAERERNKALTEDNKRMKPKEIFADAVSASDSSMLVRDVAKMIRQNGVPLGKRRFYKWLRSNGYVCQNGTSPTQKAMELGLFEIVVRTIERGNGLPIETKTTKITGKGQQYFINKFLSEEKREVTA